MKAHTKKYIAPIVCTAVLVLYLVGISLLLLATSVGEHVHIVFKILLIGGPLLGLGGVIAALVMRIREIKGGEEDVASKY